ncbi:hypothetical protein HPP92_022976 [Vanilla planifolia]|uniref:Uncharacterized protein n=1 Tax=Vanilla planifolia TaxID=51239 RepID=A0A835UFX4_VANPL|nr:hypothetical protein HPP92_023241 [Vanilla planifolia]KAG0459848.1 hypothetical protein HPP92_022976 [Vanilla planifolia]
MRHNIEEEMVQMQIAAACAALRWTRGRTWPRCENDKTSPATAVRLGGRRRLRASDDPTKPASVGRSTSTP